MMNQTLNAVSPLNVSENSPSFFIRLARKLVLRRLQGIHTGQLRLHEGGSTIVFGQHGEDTTLRAEVQIHDPRVYARLFSAGTVGAGEAYMEGLMDSPDLTALVRLFAKNREVVSAFDANWLTPGRPLLWLYHALRGNSRKGARRNIAEHYDLGNDFFRLFLDQTHMMYSSAVFPHSEATLEEASDYKMNRLCEKLDIRPHHHVLEIGTGWGGFALYAARRFGCRVTTTTISHEQFAFVSNAVREAGLEDLVTVLEKDYRDLEGMFDRIISIEMIEAVGHRHHAGFFSQCARLLKPHGLMVLQAITIADRFFEEARKNVDFIQRYIFPGGALPSVQTLAAKVGKHTPFTITALEDIGTHYAHTLREWDARVEQNHSAIRALGYSERFVRMWRFYLQYCEGGFLERSISTVQMVLAGSQWRPAGAPTQAGRVP